MTGISTFTSNSSDWKLLAQLNKLEYLELKETNIPTSALNLLSSIKNIRWLSLRKSKVLVNEPIKESLFDNLEMLDLANIGKPANEILEKWSMPNLIFLELKEDVLNNEIINHIDRFPNLKYLRIFSNQPIEYEKIVFLNDIKVLKIIWLWSEEFVGMRPDDLVKEIDKNISVSNPLNLEPMPKFRLFSKSEYYTDGKMEIMPEN